MGEPLTLPRCKDSGNPNWKTMGGWCLTHQRPMDACREERAEVAASQDDSLREAAQYAVTRYFNAEDISDDETALDAMRVLRAALAQGADR